MIDVISPVYMSAAAIAALRLVTGMLFIFQGYDRALRLSRHELLSIVPGSVSRQVAGNTSVMLIKMGGWLELIGGLMLITGFLVQPALLLLAFDLVIVTLAFSIAQPVWDLRHLFPRLVLVIFLMLTPAQSDLFSVDYLLRGMR